MSANDDQTIQRNTKLSLQKQITAILRSKILNEEYNRGEKLPSVRDLADSFSVSRETASIALNKLKEDGLIEILPSRGAYVLDRGRAERRRQKTGFIGFLVDKGPIPLPADAIDPLYESMFAFVDNQAMQFGYHLVSSYIYFNSEPSKNRLDNLLEKVDGIILVNQIQDELLNLLISTSLPLVSVLSVHNLHDVDDIGIDSFYTYVRALSHLLDYGHRHIVYLEGGMDYHHKRERLRGCRSALESHPAGTETDFTELYTEGWSPRDAYVGVKRYLKKGAPIDAVLAVNDIIAVGALQAFQEAGFSVPEDVSILGGKNTMLSETSYPPLSTIDYHYPELIKTALNRLMQRIDGTELLPAKIQTIGDIKERDTVIDRRADAPARNHTGPSTD